MTTVVAHAVRSGIALLFGLPDETPGRPPAHVALAEALAPTRIPDDVAQAGVAGELVALRRARPRLPRA